MRTTVAFSMMILLIFIMPVTASEFFDLPESHSAYVAVMQLQKLEVVNGFPDGSFQPEEPVTRAEFAKMISDFAWDIPAGEVMEFSDVTKEDWFYDTVTQAAAKKIILGNENGEFLPDSFIKKEDAALIIYRVLTEKGETYKAHRFFTDRTDVSDYARHAVEALGSVDIIFSNESGNFLPKSFLNRGEAARFLYNAFVNR